MLVQQARNNVPDTFIIFRSRCTFSIPDQRCSQTEPRQLPHFDQDRHRTPEIGHFVFVQASCKGEESVQDLRQQVGSCDKWEPAYQKCEYHCQFKKGDLSEGSGPTRLKCFSEKKTKERNCMIKFHLLVVEC